MERIVIDYSRHDNLHDNYSDKYKFEARKLIDNISDEMKEVRWIESGKIEPVYSLNINEKYLLQFKINELIKIGDAKKIAKRLNEIISKKQVI